MGHSASSRVKETVVKRRVPLILWKGAAVSELFPRGRVLLGKFVHQALQTLDHAPAKKPAGKGGKTCFKKIAHGNPRRWSGIQKEVAH